MAEKPDDVHELERQMERGSLFAHTTFTEQAARANQTEAMIGGLADLLIRRGVVDADELVAAIDETRKGIREAGRHASLDVAIRVDGEAPTVPAAAIDCEARLPYCKAVCC